MKRRLRPVPPLTPAARLLQEFGFAPESAAILVEEIGLDTYAMRVVPREQALERVPANHRHEVPPVRPGQTLVVTPSGAGWAAV
jgi:hypothetical protein